MQLPGVNAESVLTFAWDITWYQYRVSPDASQPVRIEDRGQDVTELPASFTEWNAAVGDDGRLLPNVALR